MLSERIKELRNEKGISQSALANHLGLTQQAIAKWEKGIAEPDSEMLKKIATFFDVSVDYLLGRTDIRKLNKNDNEDFPEDVKVLMRSVSKLTDKQKEIVKRLVQEFINEE
ncbi:helix-turn-helix domain-containing protein [Thermoclostridium stercorarium]|uniref:helix-turn-helix domain-containing protein n=1 Tax=Thermoclostridium stercorarium TaxID=1510 RepID=UPI00224993E7|nr:helix-turn-helix transcriptional regulator [Thermoclostridium stercorarium]UZQ85079.1 helix-turn-helix domain-containing protein [Thermoclostridium stercorarium]